MDKQAMAAGGLILTGIAAATMMFGNGQPARPKKLAGGSEACTYYASERDQQNVAEGGSRAREVLRSVLALERKCEFVTLVLPDGTRNEMKLGVAGRKPGEKGPSSTGSDFDY